MHKFFIRGRYFKSNHFILLLQNSKVISSEMAINKTQHFLLVIIPAGQKQAKPKESYWNNILILFEAIKKTDCYLSKQAKTCTNLQTKALN